MECLFYAMLCAFIPHNDMVQISLIPFYRWENQDLEIKKHTKLIDDSARIEKEALWSQNPHFQPPIKTLNYTKSSQRSLATEIYGPKNWPLIQLAVFNFTHPLLYPLIFLQISHILSMCWSSLLVHKHIKAVVNQQWRSRGSTQASAPTSRGSWLH